MKSHHVISMIIAENGLRVLQRTTGILARHRLQVEHIYGLELYQPQRSQFTIVVQADEATLTKVVQQLKRIIELLEIKTSNTVFVHQPELIANFS